MNVQGIKEVGYLDIAGGGQVRIDGNYAYIGHMAFPHGTSIVDVSDPRNPHVVAEISMPTNTHSHKVRAQDGLMVVNHERLAGEQPEDFSGGLGLVSGSEIVVRGAAPGNARTANWPGSKSGSSPE